MAVDLIKAYVDHLEDEGRSPQTVHDWEQMLRRLDRELPYGILATRDELRDAIHRRRRARDGQPLAPATRAALLAAVRGLFRFGLGQGLVDYDPTDSLPTPKIPRRVPDPPTDAEAEQVVSTAPDPYWLWFRLAGWQGLRCCEIAALDRRDINEHDTRVQGKGAKQRIVPTDTQVWSAVRDLPAGPVTHTRGPRGGAHYLSYRSAEYLDAIGLPHLTLHKFRKYYATKMLELVGGNVLAVQKLLGHESPVSTAVYAAVPDRLARAAVAALPEFSRR